MTCTRVLCTLCAVATRCAAPAQRSCLSPPPPRPCLCILPQRQATLAYIEALQQLDPPVTSSAMYEDVAGRLQDSEAFEPLDERKRRQVFGTYIGGLRRWVVDSCWGVVGD